MKTTTVYIPKEDIDTFEKKFLYDSTVIFIGKIGEDGKKVVVFVIVGDNSPLVADNIIKRYSQKVPMVSVAEDGEFINPYPPIPTSEGLFLSTFMIKDGENIPVDEVFEDRERFFKVEFIEKKFIRGDGYDYDKLYRG